MVAPEGNSHTGHFFRCDGLRRKLGPKLAFKDVCQRTADSEVCPYYAMQTHDRFKRPYIVDQDMDESDGPGEPDTTYVLSADESFMR